MRIRDSPSPSTTALIAVAAAANGSSLSTRPPVPSPPSTERSTTALAPGFRFHPTDEELVSYYLKRKVFGRPVRFNAIAQVDIYKHEPWNLSEFSKLKSRDQEWYFYSALDKKYGNGGRMNRATGRGYWKATGKDREVRGGVVLLGMKKTLVYHTGRAPDGQRTNWVMHEYRLADDFERYSATQDAYVLCRIFHKNNIGPPSGNRYAPFVEEEWDDGPTTVVPGLDAMDEVLPGNDMDNNKNSIDSNINSIDDNKNSIGDNKNSIGENENSIGENNKDNNGENNKNSIDDHSHINININLNIKNYSNNDNKNNDSRNNTDQAMADLNVSLISDEPPTETPNPIPECKMEEANDDPAPICVLNTQPSFPLLQYKRRRHNDGAPSRSNNTTPDLCSSTTTENVHATNADTTTAISALLEFSLMEPLEPKERTPPPTPPPPPRPITHLDMAIPPSIVKLISDLQKEVHKVSVERETMKLELMSAHAMLNVLQSRIDGLSLENEKLKRNVHGGGGK